jgi:DNA processing protein
MSASDFPMSVYAAAVASLPLNPNQLRVLLHRYEPADAWEQVRSGRYLVDRALRKPDELTLLLRSEAAAIDLLALRDRLDETATAVHVLGQSGYPDSLAADVFAPAVLFSSGDLGALDRHRVGIVGTRRATAAGRSIATELGVGLARNGIAVVSGLALGIDGAAHRGALACTEHAKPIGVVGCGLDVPYPERHSALWHDVRRHGLLLAEVPPGTPPAPFRFPLRNRIIATLAEVLVVVESHERGGSLLTAVEALDRNRTVMAVPGSPRNVASTGTNMLLRDGAQAVHDVTDVLTALGLGQLSFAVPVDSRRPPSPDDAVVRDALGDVPVLPEQVALAVGRSFIDVVLSLGRLEVAGWVVRSGAFFERVPFVLGARPVP